HARRLWGGDEGDAYPGAVVAFGAAFDLRASVHHQTGFPFEGELQLAALGSRQTVDPGAGCAEVNNTRGSQAVPGRAACGDPDIDRLPTRLGQTEMCDLAAQAIRCAC